MILKTIICVVIGLTCSDGFSSNRFSIVPFFQDTVNEIAGIDGSPSQLPIEVPQENASTAPNDETEIGNHRTNKIKRLIKTIIYLSKTFHLIIDVKEFYVLFQKLRKIPDKKFPVTSLIKRNQRQTAMVLFLKQLIHQSLKIPQMKLEKHKVQEMSLIKINKRNLAMKLLLKW